MAAHFLHFRVYPVGKDLRASAHGLDAELFKTFPDVRRGKNRVHLVVHELRDRLRCPGRGE